MEYFVDKLKIFKKKISENNCEYPTNTINQPISVNSEKLSISHLIETLKF